VERRKSGVSAKCRDYTPTQLSLQKGRRRNTRKKEIRHQSASCLVEVRGKDAGGKGAPGCRQKDCAGRQTNARTVLYKQNLWPGEKRVAQEYRSRKPLKKGGGGPHKKGTRTCQTGWGRHIRLISKLAKPTVGAKLSRIQIVTGAEEKEKNKAQSNRAAI